MLLMLMLMNRNHSEVSDEQLHYHVYKDEETDVRHYTGNGLAFFLAVGYCCLPAWTKQLVLGSIAPHPQPPNRKKNAWS